MLTAENEIFTLPAVNMERLIKEVNKLNKRADKLGFPHISIVTERKFEIPHPKFVQMHSQGLITKRQIPMVKMVEISLEGEPLKIEGYELMGTLDHYSIPGSVIVRTVPEQSIPAEFHDRDATCDHCKKIRRRIETFVLRETETGNHLAIGRQCVRDFIGYDVAALARYLQRWKDLTQSFTDEEDERWWGGRIQLGYEKLSVLAATYGAIRVRGWKARSHCEDGELPTSASVIDLFDPPTFFGKDSEFARREYEQFVSDVRESHDEDLIKAQKAVEWLDEQEDSNEYMHNLKVLTEAESIPQNMFGYWCSLAAAYDRAITTAAEREAAKKKQTNEWLGEVKQRLEFDVEVISYHDVEGAYDVVRIFRMMDKDGHTLVWFCNGNSNMEKGQKYHIKGTVKKHDEYKDWKQTILSRVAVLTEEAA